MEQQSVILIALGAIDICLAVLILICRQPFARWIAQRYARLGDSDVADGETPVRSRWVPGTRAVAVFGIILGAAGFLTIWVAIFG